MIAVRTATAVDLPALAALMIDFYAESSFPLTVEQATAGFRGLLGQPDRGAIFIGHVDNEPAGFAVLTIVYSMEFGGLRGFVDDFFVQPSSRRLGVGGGLLAAIRTHAVAAGLKALLVEVSGDNDTALRVYRRAGFADTGHALYRAELGPALHETRVITA